MVLEEKKAENIQLLDVKTFTSVCDVMILASGHSTQHTRALANYVIEVAKKQSIAILGVEGQENREWILVDLGNVIVHIMLPETRAYYEIEKLWSASSE